MNHSIETNLKDIFSLLSKGQFIEAMEKHLHAEVQLREVNAEPKVGKDHCISVEKEILKGVGEFIQYTVSDYAINGDVSFYEAVMEYKEVDGTHVKVEQSVVSRWKDGKIINERYYHA